jgi:hypothetical protein
MKMQKWLRGGGLFGRVSFSVSVALAPAQLSNSIINSHFLFHSVAVVCRIASMLGEWKFFFAIFIAIVWWWWNVRKCVVELKAK